MTRTSNEVFGTKALTIIVIAGSLFLLLAMLGSPAPQASATQPQAQQTAQETVVAANSAA